MIKYIDANLPYRLTEFCFVDGCFDEVEVLRSVIYR